MSEIKPLNIAEDLLYCFPCIYICVFVLVSSSGRFPVEKLQAELARMASKKPPKEPEEDAEVESGNMFLNAKSLLKPVNRVESLNTPEKPKMPTVKRAESDNPKRMEPIEKKFDRKISKISEMKDTYESDEGQPEKQGVNLSPMFPRKDPSGNRNIPPVANVKPTRAVPLEPPIKKVPPKPETIEAPPAPRASPFRNFKDEANSRGLCLM